MKLELTRREDNRNATLVCVLHSGPPETMLEPLRVLEVLLHNENVSSDTFLRILLA